MTHLLPQRHCRHRTAIYCSRHLWACALALLAWVPVVALAWGPTGHRLVGRLAADELTPQARQEIARLLQGHPEPTLAGVANWADELRDTNADLGRRTARWHYVNIADDDCRYVRLLDCPGGDCVIEAIAKQRDLLADRRQPDAVRAQALKFIAHLVGDAHQPLHAGYARDHGGNTVQVQVAGKGSNLHWVWDGEILFSSNLRESRYLRYLRRLPLPVNAGDRDVPAWAVASCRIVLQDGFYPTKPIIDAAYFSRWRPTADQQLRVAGHRLAKLLNEALGNSGMATPPTR